METELALPVSIQTCNRFLRVRNLAGTAYVEGTKGRLVPRGRRDNVRRNSPFIDTTARLIAFVVSLRRRMPKRMAKELRELRNYETFVQQRDLLAFRRSTLRSY